MKTWVKVTAAGAALLATYTAGAAIGTREVVEGPTRVITKTVPGPTRTVTKQVEVVPQSALDALDLADQIHREVGNAFDAASVYPPLIAKAYKAGYTMDAAAAQKVLAQVKTTNEDLNGHADKIPGMLAEFRVAEARVRVLAQVNN